MRVVSWNVWWRFGGNWRERQHGIGATLERLRPDVVGLQEAWARDGTTQPDLLAQRLGMHAAFAAPSFPPAPVPPETPDQDGAEVGVGLLSRWPIRWVRQHRLPSVHRHEPVTLIAELDHPDGPVHTAVSCVEWEVAYAHDQTIQLRTLAALLADTPSPVVLAADLNAPAGSPMLGLLTDVMVDAWVAGGGDPDAVTLSSANPFAPREVPHLIDQRIDHVLVRSDRPVEVERAFVVDEAVDGLPPSDHNAVVVDLRL